MIEKKRESGKTVKIKELMASFAFKSLAFQVIGFGIILIIVGFMQHWCSQITNSDNVKTASSEALWTLAGLFLAFLIVQYFLINRGFIGRLNGLIRTASRFGIGELTARADASHNDEMGIMARTFNVMADGIQLSSESLQSEISERRASEIALRKSEERYRAFVSQSSEAIWCFESVVPIPTTASEDQQIDMIYGHGYLAECNDVMARMYGLERADEIIGTRIENMLIRSDPKNVEYLRAFIRSGYRLTDAETGEPDRDGKIRYFLNNLIGVVEDGYLLRAWGTQRDITERKQAEEALRESEIKYRTLFNRIAEPVLIFDNETYKFLECNEAVFKAYGYSIEELRTMTPFDLCAPEDVEKARSQIDKSSPEHVGAYKYITRDGSRVDVEVLSEEIEYQGRPACLSIIRDITARNLIEAEMKRARDAAIESARLKSQFIANMSHEIRTPMNGILGMMELALDTNLNDEQLEYIETARSSAQALMAVINDLLDFSKLEEGRLDIEASEFSLRNTLSEISKIMARRAHEKQLELAFQVPAQIPDRLVGDPRRLHQVIVNLLGNAIKFTEQGEVVLSLDVESIAEKEITLHFAVRDTGIGIPAEKHGIIFGAFMQADGSTTRRYGGSGLGLTISSRLVELMRGRIWLESEPGCGSTFHFTATFGLRARAESDPGRPDLAALRGLRVLIVDDNAVNRRILEEMTSHWSMVPTCVESGKTALARLKQASDLGEPFDFVLLDVQMPEMDGFTVAERILKAPELAGSAILMLTSLELPGAAARCKQPGVASYIVKPVMQASLLDAILGALNTRKDEQEDLTLKGRNSSTESNTGLHILVVEDSLVNQHVAARLLQKQGHNVALASNGRKALEAFEKDVFDLILMDIQMPEMNGFEVTAAIRERERLSNRRTPIVAMTANEMKSDRERCIEAGMDGFISKPIQADELYDVIKRLVAASSQDSLARKDANVIDRAALMKQFDGDSELMRLIIETFIECQAEYLSKVRDAVDEGDAKRLYTVAHSLKGAISNFHAPSVSALAVELEMMGRNGDLPGAGEKLAELELGIKSMNEALAEIAEELIITKK